MQHLTKMRASDWLCLASVLAVAMGMRLVFYTGFFGSDEVTYVKTAATIASGDWRASDYIGAIRYGMNLPVALFIHWFGLSESSANLWPLLCSIGEVALVFMLARWFWNTRTAVICAGLLALLPLHVHFAGRMMADPPLAFFLTLSVALLLRAVPTASWWVTLAAGLAWAGVFWVKESVALLYLPVFLLLAFYVSRFKCRWSGLFSGMALGLAANSGLMLYVADSPAHVFTVMKAAVIKIADLSLDTSPAYYLRYLFADLRHTFLLGYLAAAGALLYGRHYLRRKPAPAGTAFVVLWVLLLIGMFSLAVVSFAPVKLVMKQTNYMLIFAAPLALLAGWFLASLPSRIFMPVAALVVCGSVVLGALEQQAVMVFTANSKTAYALVRDHPQVYLLGSVNNERAVQFYAMMEQRPELRDRALSIGDWEEALQSHAAPDWPTRIAHKEVRAVLDLQNADWGTQAGSIRRLSDVPKCWSPAGLLNPVSLGNGRWLVQGLVKAGGLLPAHWQRTYTTLLKPVAEPAPAYLFGLAPGCTK